MIMIYLFTTYFDDAFILFKYSVENTVPVKCLDTPSRVVFLYFYYFEHCALILKTTKL